MSFFGGFILFEGPLKQRVNIIISCSYSAWAKNVNLCNLLRFDEQISVNLFYLVVGC
jgi:hypothetical protein